MLDSGLDWKMVLYGEEEEEMMAQSEDPVVKEIWDRKIVEEYSPTPQVKATWKTYKLIVELGPDLMKVQGKVAKFLQFFSEKCDYFLDRKCGQRQNCFHRLEIRIGTCNKCFLHNSIRSAFDS